MELLADLAQLDIKLGAIRSTRRQKQDLVRQLSARSAPARRPESTVTRSTRSGISAYPPRPPRVTSAAHSTQSAPYAGNAPSLPPIPYPRPSAPLRAIQPSTHRARQGSNSPAPVRVIEPVKSFTAVAQHTMKKLPARWVPVVDWLHGLGYAVSSSMSFLATIDRLVDGFVVSRALLLVLRDSGWSLDASAFESGESHRAANWMALDVIFKRLQFNLDEGKRELQLLQSGTYSDEDGDRLPALLIEILESIQEMA